MKQHITEEQLQEISSEKQFKLSKIIYGEDNKNRIAPWDIIIGKMIEILGDNWVDKLYGVNYDHEIYCLYEVELCDALWEEVKTVL